MIPLLIAFLFFLNYDSDNRCLYHADLYDSHLFPSQQSQVKVRKHIPSSRQLSQPLKISPILFQTNQQDTVPSLMGQAILNNIQLNPQFEYRFFDAQDRERFMAAMGERYERAYKVLLPRAYKADLWRYAAVYQNGGCYIDAGTIMVRPFKEILRGTDEFVSSEDCEGRCINAAFFCAVKGSTILLNTLDLAIQAIETRNYGKDALDITGPYKLMQGFKQYVKTPIRLIQVKDYGNGLRILGRASGQHCLISVVMSGNQTVLVAKYPAYQSDMSWYSKFERYSVIWVRREVFIQDQDQPQNWVT